MGFYNVVNATSLQAGFPEDVSQVLANFQAIAAVLNGGIDDSNVNAGANISLSKLNLPQDLLHALLPIGGFIPYLGASDPAGGWFMIFDGRSLLRASYVDLFNLIGTTWGSVDGTHFNIPDFRGRTVFGVDGAAARLTANDTLGAFGGVEKHPLVEAELGSHDHDMSSHTHAYSHDHITQTGASVGGGGQVTRGTGVVVDLGGGGAGAPCKIFSGSTGGPSTNLTGAAGSGTAHQNMPPYGIANWLGRVL